jgi:hypothetical protein
MILLNYIETEKKKLQNKEGKHWKEIRKKKWKKEEMGREGKRN